MGNRETKITRPFIRSLRALTPRAIIRPKTISTGVTVKVKVRVNAIDR